MCGTNNGDITNCHNDGAVSGGNSVGGVCGTGNDSGIAGSDAYITYCYNTGSVNGSTSVGGVCGVNNSSGEADANVTNCYNTGAVTSDGNKVGGVCGENISGSVINCYNIGVVSGAGKYGYYVGGVCGYNNGTITNCYYLTGCAKDGSGHTQNGIGNETKGETTPDDPEKTAGKPATEFSSGAVAWLLNTAGGSSAHSGVWSQGEKSPIFADSTHKAIYKITISGAKTAEYYTDAAGKFAPPETVYIAGISTETIHTADISYTADAAITGVVPTVTDSISFAYDVTVAKDLIPTLSVTLGSKTVTLMATEKPGSGDYRNYSFVFEGILPQQMTKNISATLIIGGTEYAKKSQYSMRRYVFNNLPSSDKKLEKFLVNMLYYGAAAQSYLGQTDLATEGLVELLGANTVNSYRTKDTEWAEITTENNSVKAVTDTNDTDLITWKSATLVFDTTITMRLRFTTTAANFAALSESNATFDVSFGDDIALSDAVLDTKAAADPNNVDLKTYYIDIKGFTPTDYTTKVTVVLKDASNATVSETVTYSVMSYIANKKDSETMKTLVRALYDYGISGKEYVE